MEEVEIKTEYIRLCDALKFCGAAESGGHAKTEIENKNVSVCGEICTQRGKKLRPGDVFTYRGVSRKIAAAKT